MPNRTFVILTAVCLMFPIGASAAQLNQENNYPQTAPAMNKFAQHPASFRKRPSRGERMNKMLQQLDLSAEQSQRIETIKEEFKAKNVALDEEIKTNHQQGRLSLGSDASPEELRQQHQRVQALHQQLNNNRFEMMLQVREVLTPEQQDQLAELIEQKRNQRRS